MKKQSMRWGNWYVDSAGVSRCYVVNTGDHGAPACWSAALTHSSDDPKRNRVTVSVGSWKAEFTNVTSEASAKRWAGLVARELMDLYDLVHGQTRRERLRRKTLEFDPMLASKAKR